MKSTQKIYDLQSLNFLRSISRLKSRSLFGGVSGANKPLKIGILGGSFNPAHIGHLSISMQALNKFGMDYVIWVVAKQNPLKEQYQDDIYTRASEACKISNDKRILVSTIEEEFGSSYIYNTMQSILKYFPYVDFTWLMGIDNLIGFNRWYMHNAFTKLCKIIIFDRDCRGRFVNNGLFISKYEPVVDNSQTNPIILFRGRLSPASSSSIRDGK